MKLVVQIPCYNEQDFLPAAVNAVPERIAGIDKIEIIVIDDGSADRTAGVAQAHPRVAKVIKLPYHQGLAAAFRAGIDAAINLSADIIVNTDADNQYPGAKIPELIKPILENKAEVVVGCRDIENVKHFSFGKKIAQRAGSRVISSICGQQIPDATSGFRAFNRDSALWIDVIASNYTYTLETLVRLASQKVRISHVPITINPPVRKSRLMGSSSEYIARSALDILTLLYIYSPLKVFVALAAFFGFPGLFLIARFCYYYYVRTICGHILSGYEQSLTLGIGLLIIGFFMLMMGVISNLIHTNRKILERLLFLRHKDTQDQR